MASQITPAEFARQMGVSPQAVHRAMKEGRITASHDEQGRTLINPETAAREWSENTRYRIEANGARSLQKTVDAIPKRSQLDARAVREAYEAKMTELKYKRAVGELVRADEVLAGWSTIITMARTKLLGVPSKAKLRIPELTTAQVGILDELIREALDDLSESHEEGKQLTGI